MRRRGFLGYECEGECFCAGEVYISTKGGGGGLDTGAESHTVVWHACEHTGVCPYVLRISFARTVKVEEGHGDSDLVRKGGRGGGDTVFNRSGGPRARYIADLRTPYYTSPDGIIDCSKTATAFTTQHFARAPLTTSSTTSMIASESSCPSPGGTQATWPTRALQCG